MISERAFLDQFFEPRESRDCWPELTRHPLNHLERPGKLTISCRRGMPHLPMGRLCSGVRPASTASVGRGQGCVVDELLSLFLMQGQACPLQA